jgi:hypothetical protein
VKIEVNSILGKSFNSDLLIAFLVGIVLMLIGLYLIINNKIVTKNLLQNIGIFQTKEVKREAVEMKTSKLISARIITYIVGLSFSSMGIFLLYSFLRRILVN